MIWLWCPTLASPIVTIFLGLVENAESQYLAIDFDVITTIQQKLKLKKLKKIYLPHSKV